MDSQQPESTRGVMTQFLQLRYGDLDTLGHMNSVVYFSFFETARWGFFEALGFQPVEAFLVAHSECDYIAEVPGTAREIALETWAVKAGRTSITVGHRVLYEGVLRARGSAVMVRTDGLQRPRPLTDAEREALTRYPGAPDAPGMNGGSDPSSALLGP